MPVIERDGYYYADATTDRQDYVSEHFKVYELACRCCGVLKVKVTAVTRLEAMRKYLGEPLSLNSACRCEKHNADVNGARDSKHKFTNAAASTAFDVRIVNSKQAYDYVEAAIKVGFLGIGVSDDAFIHVDERPQKRLWTY